jgi:hypothetical protein
MDFWLQLAWPDSTEVNSFTEVDMQTSEIATFTFCSKSAADRFTNTTGEWFLVRKIFSQWATKNVTHCMCKLRPH